MLEEVLQYLNNWFVSEVWAGTFIVQGGSIELDLQEGDYFRIVGSRYNDGVYQYGDELKDETFDGSVWVLAIPTVLLSIVAEIEKWSTDNPAGAYSSESFGGYSYSKIASKTGGAVTWRDVFGDRLAPYRKLLDTTMRGSQSYQSPPYRRPFNPDYPCRE